LEKFWFICYIIAYMKKHFWKIVGLVALLALGASFIFANQAAKKANVGVVVETRVKGNPDAQVVITEYSDFQCPACAQMEPVLKEVMDKYGDQIRFEYKHFPLISIHPFAVPAAKASEAAAQQGKFWEMHDKLFENQSVWSKGGSPEAYFIKYAEEIGLDVSTFRRHLGSSVISDAISTSFKEAQGLGLTGTPALFLNGQRMTYTTYADFIVQVETALGIAPATTQEAGAAVAVPQEPEVKFGI
jgi:protein-disulfide isomerase